MLSMLEWLCTERMEAEVDQQLGAEKSERSGSRNGYRSGYRPRRLDTRMGTMYLMVPKVRQGGYIPFFVTERKRSEAALIQVVQEAFVQGVSTRKMEKPGQRDDKRTQSFGSPFPEPLGSAARYISCGISCRRKRSSLSPPC